MKNEIYKKTFPAVNVDQLNHHIFPKLSGDKPDTPVDTGRKLNVHKTFRRRPGRLLNVLCTFNLRPVSTGTVIIHVGVNDMMNGIDRDDLILYIGSIGFTCKNCGGGGTL